MPAQNDLPTMIDVVQDIAQEKGLATTTDAEMAVLFNLALLEIRNDHDFSELITSTDLSFVASSTNPYATVSAPAALWEPIRLNNATDDYNFWYMEPNALRDLRRDDRYTYQDIEQAFAKDGSNLLIYHGTTETLTLYYYSRYLVDTATTGVDKETFNTNGTAADSLRLNNDNLLIQRVLMFLYQKEPNSENDYLIAKQTYEANLAAEKRLNPSQKIHPRLESITYIG